MSSRPAPAIDSAAPRAAAAAAAPPLSQLLEPIQRDPLTVAGDGNFLAQIAAQPNVPHPIAKGLAKLY
jgi:hypothetical protein